MRSVGVEMVEFYSAVLALLFVCTATIPYGGALEPVCKPEQTSAYAPRLPQLPDAFTTSIEINIANKNYSLFYTEYYDLHGNRGALHRSRNGQRTQSIYDYNYDEVVEINEAKGKCFVEHIDQLRKRCRFSFFGGNRSQIEGVADLFNFGASWNESYQGVKEVRGIKCFHWRACVVPSKVFSYTLDYYFSVTNWKPNGTLVRAEINGTAQNMNCSNGTFTPIDGTHSFYHVYDFINFKAGVPDSGVFQPPRGLFCEGYRSANRSRPKLPPAFSVMLEAVQATNKTVREWKEVYDYDLKLFMLNYQDRQNPKKGQVNVIYDLNVGIGYNISRRTSQCEIFPVMPNKSFITTEDSSHHLQMKTAQELFFGLGASTFLGSSNVRGIEVEIWSFKRNSSRANMMYVTELSFSKATWDMRAGSLTQHQVPVEVTWYSPRGSLKVNMFNFDGESVTPSTFDVRPCFARNNERLFVYFHLKANYSTLGKNQEFIRMFVLTIAKTANVSILRVSGFKLLPALDGISANFLLLDKPALHSEMMQYVRPEKGLKEAAIALKKSVESGRFQVRTNGGASFPAVPDSYFDNYWPLEPWTNQPTNQPTNPSGKPGPGRPTKAKSSGVPKGAVAGVAFVMLAIGIAGGLGIAHVIMKRRGTGLFNYQRQA